MAGSVRGVLTMGNPVPYDEFDIADFSILWLEKWNGWNDGGRIQWN